MDLRRGLTPSAERFVVTADDLNDATKGQEILPIVQPGLKPFGRSTWTFWRAAMLTGPNVSPVSSQHR